MIRKLALFILFTIVYKIIRENDNLNIKTFDFLYSSLIVWVSSAELFNSNPNERIASKNPEIRVDTKGMSPMQAAQDIYLYLIREGYISNNWCFFNDVLNSVYFTPYLVL